MCARAVADAGEPGKGMQSDAFASCNDRTVAGSHLGDDLKS